MAFENGKRGWLRGSSRGFAWVAAAAAGMSAAGVWACGGFFCQLVTIDQAGELIIFRQDGDRVTAVVQIQYVGEAEDFSWVVPVPGVPDLSVGSDLVFQQLEPATRPQFNLTVNGEPCFDPVFFPPIAGFAASDDLEFVDEDSGVEILAEAVVGPFETVVVRSEDPAALATWLDENGYDLTDRGAELIDPYVTEGMNFVALKLRQDQGVGDLQPLIMRYTSDRPMIPIRLTAVAAMPDMGVIVWLLGDARAVPTNYLAVEPNYTRLDWYSGSFNAYASYQDLITAAMNEAGGQGFATDFAGRGFDADASLPDATSLRTELDNLRQQDTASFYLNLFFNAFYPQTKVLEILRRELPLPDDVDEFNYAEAGVLNAILDEATVEAARQGILGELEATVVDPLEETLAVFDGDPYMTRLYTTLSADEMTLDPEFTFNPDLSGQTLERAATLDLECVAGRTDWTLTLGAGTGRDGEVVIKGRGESPLFTSPPTIDQLAVAESAMVSDSGAPRVVTKNIFETAVLGAPVTTDLSDRLSGRLSELLSMCGVGILGSTLMSTLGLALFAAARRRA